MDDPRRPGPRTIEQCVAAWQRACGMLLADKQLASDEAILMAMFEADPNILSPDDLLKRFVAAIYFSEARAAEAKATAAALANREKRYTRRADLMRLELLEVLQALQRTTFSGSPFGTVSVGHSAVGTVVHNEAKIPEEYFDTTRTLSRARLLADMKVGVVVEGAELSNPRPVLRFIKSSTIEE